LALRAVDRRAAADDDASAAPIELTTNEKKRIPTNITPMATPCSREVFGVMSPYPTVVRVVTAKYAPAK